MSNGLWLQLSSTLTELICLCAYKITFLLAPFFSVLDLTLWGMFLNKVIAFCANVMDPVYLREFNVTRYLMSKTLIL